MIRKVECVGVMVLLLILCSSSTTVHPLKMTFSKMTLSNGAVELTTKIFLDDLVRNIKKRYRLNTPDFSSVVSNGTQSLQDYFNKKLYIEQNGKMYTFSIESVSIIEDGVVLLVKSKSEKGVKNASFMLTNALFYEEFPNQVNSVKLEKEEKRFNLRQKTMSFNE